MWTPEMVLAPARTGTVAIERGTRDGVVLEEEVDAARATERDQPRLRVCARAQGRRPGQHALLKGVVGVVEQGEEDTRAGAEPAEDRALSQSGPLRQLIHRQLVHAVLGDHLAGDRQQMLAVAHRVGALGAGPAEGQIDGVHRANLPSE